MSRTLPTLSILLCALAAPAHAQVLGGLPDVRVPAPIVRPLTERIADVPGDLRDGVVAPLARQLVRRHPEVLALAPDGAAILRQEVVAIDPRPASLEAARAVGFALGTSRTLEPLGLRVVTLRLPAGLEAAAALALLRKLDPGGTYDFNHLYFGSGNEASGRDAHDGPVSGSATKPLRIGLIDGGVDQRHPALREVAIHAWGCDGRSVPDAHGTAVASLLSPATLYTADVYCGEPTGGSATAVAGAMAWLARESVPVVNISLVGPDNALLRRATAAMVERGHVLVSAVGNAGPAAAPLYPAAYAGVIGVTAVDDRARVLPEAVRGAQVDFAAQGAGLRAADAEGGWQDVRGTSFAAPLVARAAAIALAPGAAEDPASTVRARLAADARDLGRPGRDDTYGLGLLGARN